MRHHSRLLAATIPVSTPDSVFENPASPEFRFLNLDFIATINADMSCYLYTLSKIDQRFRKVYRLHNS